MTLQVEVYEIIGRPVEDVFDAWVDPEKIAGYFISRGSGRLEAGKTVVWTWDEYDVQCDVEVKTLISGLRV